MRISYSKLLISQRKPSRGTAMIPVNLETAIIVF